MRAAICSHLVGLDLGGGTVRDLESLREIVARKAIQLQGRERESAIEEQLLARQDELEAHRVVVDELAVSHGLHTHICAHAGGAIESHGTRACIAAGVARTIKALEYSSEAWKKSRAW